MRSIYSHRNINSIERELEQRGYRFYATKSYGDVYLKYEGEKQWHVAVSKPPTWSNAKRFKNKVRLLPFVPNEWLRELKEIAHKKQVNTPKRHALEGL